jgi:hypothetical protein
VNNALRHSPEDAERVRRKRASTRKVPRSSQVRSNLLPVHEPSIPILFFADEVLGINPYDWQCRILLNYEAGHPTAAAAANFSGKTSSGVPDLRVVDLGQFSHRPRHVFERHRQSG